MTDIIDRTSLYIADWLKPLIEARLRAKLHRAEDFNRINIISTVNASSGEIAAKLGGIAGLIQSNLDRTSDDQFSTIIDGRINIIPLETGAAHFTLLVIDRTHVPASIIYLNPKGNPLPDDDQVVRPALQKWFATEYPAARFEDSFFDPSFQQQGIFNDFDCGPTTALNGADIAAALLSYASSGLITLREYLQQCLTVPPLRDPNNGSAWDLTEFRKQDAAILQLTGMDVAYRDKPEQTLGAIIAANTPEAKKIREINGDVDDIFVALNNNRSRLGDLEVQRRFESAFDDAKQRVEQALQNPQHFGLFDGYKAYKAKALDAISSFPQRVGLQPVGGVPVLPPALPMIRVY